MAKATVTKITKARRKAEPTDDFVSVNIPRSLYDDLRAPPKDPDPPRMILAAEAEEIGNELSRVGDVLWAMHQLAMQAPDNGVDAEVLAIAVARLSRDAFIVLDANCEKLGSVRMGRFDPVESTDETAEAEVQS